MREVKCVEGALAMRKARHTERRETARIKNEPPCLTVGEEILNALSHALGAGMAVAATVLLLLRSQTAAEITASCFYGVSMVVMLMMSSVYHALPAGSSAKRVCRRFDYLSIYLLIGGTLFSGRHSETANLYKRAEVVFLEQNQKCKTCCEENSRRAYLQHKR